jgi:hypothetical protein
VHPARLPRELYLSGQLKLFHIYPVNMVNSKKNNQTKRLTLWASTALSLEMFFFYPM